MKIIHEKIDKLTNSIENAFTGERFLTDILPVSIEDIKEKDWIFDWKSEISSIRFNY